MGLELVTAPTSYPITLEEAKLHLRLGSATEHDARVQLLVSAATRMWEETTGIALVTQTLRLTLDRFPCEQIDLPRWPVASITSIIYTDENGDNQTMSASDYKTELTSQPARVFPAYDTYWPTTRAESGAVRVLFVAGRPVYDLPKHCPDAIHAVKLLVSHWFENADPTSTDVHTDVPMALGQIMRNRRLWSF